MAVGDGDRVGGAAAGPGKAEVAPVGAVVAGFNGFSVAAFRSVSGPLAIVHAPRRAQARVRMSTFR